MVEVAIDTASEMAGVALTGEGQLVAELTWRTRQNHSRELLPVLELLLERARLSRGDVTAISVCLGPGSYAGLRVGVSTAKALAYGLGVPVVGVGRLAAEALPFAAGWPGRTIAVHAAGRAELAWAAYAAAVSGVHELTPPRLLPRDAFVAALGTGDLVVGEVEAALRESIARAGARWAAPVASRVVAVAALGWERLRAGDIDAADSLVPLYLREPAIGPQTPRA